MATDIANIPPTSSASSLTPPATIDGTGLASTVPLLIKTAKTVSGVELQGTGSTISPGYILNDSTGTAKGGLGLIGTIGDFYTSSIVGNVALTFPTGKTLTLAVHTGARVADWGSSGSTSYVDFSFGTGAALQLAAATSLTACALQRGGDPNTGISFPSGADTLTLVVGGVAALTVTTTFASLKTGVDWAFDVAGAGSRIGNSSANKMGFWGATAGVQPTNGANLTNNVTSGGTDDTIANYTDLTIYANDAAAIRNDIYQLARKLKVVNDALRVIGIMS